MATTPPKEIREGIMAVVREYDLPMVASDDQDEDTAWFHMHTPEGYPLGDVFFAVADANLDIEVQMSTEFYDFRNPVKIAKKGIHKHGLFKALVAGMMNAAGGLCLLKTRKADCYVDHFRGLGPSPVVNPANHAHVVGEVDYDLDKGEWVVSLHREQYEIYAALPHVVLVRDTVTYVDKVLPSPERFAELMALGEKNIGILEELAKERVEQWRDDLMEAGHVCVVKDKVSLECYALGTDIGRRDQAVVINGFDGGIKPLLEWAPPALLQQVAAVVMRYPIRHPGTCPVLHGQAAEVMEVDEGMDLV